VSGEFHVSCSKSRMSNLARTVFTGHKIIIEIRLHPLESKDGTNSVRHCNQFTVKAV
jgi:hypothetical protein